MSAQTGTIQETGLPQAGVWQAEPAHTTIEFVAKHLMITNVRGRFGEFDARIELADDPADSRVEASIKTASIDTNAPQRDGHLKSPDFLDVENYPEITFTSTRIERAGDSKFKVTGAFKIKDVSRPLTLAVEFLGDTVGPLGPVAVFSVRGEFNREDYGMNWNQALESGGWLVSKKVRIEIEAEFVRPTES